MVYPNSYGSTYENNKNQHQQIQITKDTPETITNPLYTPGFLRQQIGKLVRIEFLIGTTSFQDRTRISGRCRSKLCTTAFD